VRFIQDENFVAIARRRKSCSLAKVTGIIDTVVASRVDFDNVNRTAAIA
jgi:hypothetical protein